MLRFLSSPLLAAVVMLAAGCGSSSSSTSTQLGAVKRPDGKLQVAYAGHLLYTYALEKRPGETLGNGASSFGGTPTSARVR